MRWYSSSLRGGHPACRRVCGHCLRGLAEGDRGRHRAGAELSEVEISECGRCLRRGRRGRRSRHRPDLPGGAGAARVRDARHRSVAADHHRSGPKRCIHAEPDVSDFPLPHVSRSSRRPGRCPIDSGSRDPPARRSKRRRRMGLRIMRHAGGGGCATIEGDQGRPAARQAPSRGRALRSGALRRSSQGQGGTLISDDNSNTQFAVLAVWLARKHGVPVDSARSDRAAFHPEPEPAHRRMELQRRGLEARRVVAMARPPCTAPA